jgi:hypothetical protein
VLFHAVVVGDWRVWVWMREGSRVRSGREMGFWVCREGGMAVRREGSSSLEADSCVDTFEVDSGVAAAGSDTVVVVESEDLLVPAANASSAFFFVSLAFCAASSAACFIADARVPMPELAVDANVSIPTLAVDWVVSAFVPVVGLSGDFDVPSIVDTGSAIAVSVVAFEGFDGVSGDACAAAGLVGVPVPSNGTILICCFNSPYSFQSSTSTISCTSQYVVGRPWVVGGHTPSTNPSCTRPGSFLARPDSSFPDLRPHSMRAFSSVATSSALKGMRFALRIVSSREVAVTMWDEPAVREV